MHAAGCSVTHGLVHSVEALHEFVEVDGAVVVFIHLQKNGFGTQRVRFDPTRKQHPFEVSEVDFIALATRLHMDIVVSVVQPDLDINRHAFIHAVFRTNLRLKVFVLEQQLSWATDIFGDAFLEHGEGVHHGCEALGTRLQGCLTRHLSLASTHALDACVNTCKPVALASGSSVTRSR